MMSKMELDEKLNELQFLPAETEVVEFKEAKAQFDFHKLGKYFSALSNEAHLKHKKSAWLIFGIKDKGHTVVGSSFRTNRVDLDSLKAEIADKTTNRITFIEIYELKRPEGRVVMFEIPPAPKGVPVAFEGHYYGRDGETLSPLNIEEMDRIRSLEEDWSAQICVGATIEDLDQEAIKIARENFKSKMPSKAAEVDTWDDITFLNKAKITIKGQVTRAAIILLGKPESEHFINPGVAKIRWVLKDESGHDKDYHIESCPFLLAVDKIYSKVRNLKYRPMKEGSLFPEEVDQYEPYLIREAINNCIAHQDYTKGGRINLVEIDDHLVFTNLGTFIPGSVEKVVIDNAPEEHYRNKFLADAMFNLKMVDTAGGGIRKMFNYQRERFFPLPEYDLSGGKIKVTITGKVLDIEFAKTLARNPGLNLEEIIMLDKIQKKKLLSEIEAKWLRERGLIEGRKPNYHFSAHVAGNIGQKADYIKNKGFDDDYYRSLIKQFIVKYKKATRKEIDNLLWEKLPNILDEKQKSHKIANLLSSMRNKKQIENIGTTIESSWVIVGSKTAKKKKSK